MWPIIDALKIDSEFRTEKSAFRALPSSPELNEIFDQLVDKLNISRRELARKLKVNNNSVEACAAMELQSNTQFLYGY